jgi:hypothetical protein
MGRRGSDRDASKECCTRRAAPTERRARIPELLAVGDLGMERVVDKSEVDP